MPFFKAIRRLNNTAGKAIEQDNMPRIRPMDKDVAHYHLLQ